MTKPVTVVTLILLVSLCSGVVTEGAQEKPRVLVLTDIANEPDDEESLGRLLVSAGGANTRARALTDLHATRSVEAVETAVTKLRVYAISDQDDAGAWLRREFPELFDFVSPSRQHWKAQAPRRNRARD